MPTAPSPRPPFSPTEAPGSAECAGATSVSQTGRPPWRPALLLSGFSVLVSCRPPAVWMLDSPWPSRWPRPSSPSTTESSQVAGKTLSPSTHSALFSPVSIPPAWWLPHSLPLPSSQPCRSQTPTHHQVHRRAQGALGCPASTVPSLSPRCPACSPPVIADPGSAWSHPQAF